MPIRRVEALEDSLYIEGGRHIPSSLLLPMLLVSGYLPPIFHSVHRNPMFR